MDIEAVFRFYSEVFAGALPDCNRVGASLMDGLTNILVLPISCLQDFGVCPVVGYVVVAVFRVGEIESGVFYYFLHVGKVHDRR